MWCEISRSYWAFLKTPFDHTIRNTDLRAVHDLCFHQDQFALTSINFRTFTDCLLEPSNLDFGVLPFPLPLKLALRGQSRFVLGTEIWNSHAVLLEAF